MRIKHWQGYGCVEAKKISKQTINGITTLHIKVKGNHECGIHREDRYDISNWLIKRFDKSFSNYKDIIDIKLKDDIEDGIDVCNYYIKYKTKR